MNRLFQAARGLLSLGLVAGVLTLAEGSARAGGLLGKHHAAPVVGVASPAYVMPASPVYVLGSVRHHGHVGLVNTTGTTVTTTATPPPFVGAVAPIYGFSAAAPAVYSIAPVAAPAQTMSLVPAMYGYNLNLAPAAAAAAAPVSSKSYLSLADVPGFAPASAQAPASAGTPAGQRILHGLLQFAESNAGQIASALGPLLLQEAQRLFVSEFGALPSSSDFAILGRIAQFVLDKALGGGQTAGPGPSNAGTLGNGQTIHVQTLTIQASTVQVIETNPNPNPVPNPNPAPNPNPVPNPPNTNPSEPSPPPTS